MTPEVLPECLVSQSKERLSSVLRQKGFKHNSHSILSSWSCHTRAQFNINCMRLFPLISKPTACALSRSYQQQRQLACNGYGDPVSENSMVQRRVFSLHTVRLRSRSEICPTWCVGNLFPPSTEVATRKPLETSTPATWTWMCQGKLQLTISV